MICDEVVAAVAGAPRAVAAVGTAARLEVAATEEAAAAPVVPAVVTTAAVSDLLAACGDATGRAASGRSPPRRKVISSLSVLGARVWPRGESTCTLYAVVLAIELLMSEQGLAVKAQAFVAEEIGK